jgi:hypothetical protein
MSENMTRDKYVCVRHYSLYANDANTSSFYCKHMQIFLSHLLQQYNSLHKIPKLRVSFRNITLILSCLHLYNIFVPISNIFLFVYSEMTSISFHTKTLLNSKNTFLYARMRKRFSLVSSEPNLT